MTYNTELNTKYRRAYRKRHPEEERERARNYMRIWRLRNLEKMREYERNRARRPEVILQKREARLQALYRISLADYAQLVESQDGLCAICLEVPRQRTIRGVVQPAFVVDHDHETGKVRGLLCDKCNLIIGRFGEDPARFERAAAYLTRRSDTRHLKVVV